MRRTFAVVLGAILLASALVPSAALAKEQADPSGTYLGTVTGSSGKTYEAWAQYGKSRFGFVILTVKVANKASFPIPIRPVWTSPTSFTVNKTVWIPGVVEGSGSAAWTQSGDTWTVTGEGTGSVFGGPEGSGTGQGVRISTEFIEPPLKAKPLNMPRGTKAAIDTKGAANLKPVADASGDALVAATAMGESGRTSDGGKVEAGLAAAAAVFAGVLLCMALGASMSGAEFAELWTAPEEGSKQ